MGISVEVSDVRVVGVGEIIPDLYLTWEEECKIVREWCEKHNAHYYARPRESFSRISAVFEAVKLGKKIVVVEDLS